MKKIFLSTLLCCSLPVFANINANNGVYVGADLGAAFFNQVEGTALASELTHLAPVSFLYFRPMIGFRFNDYLALEASYNDLEDDEDGIDPPYGPDHYRFYFSDVSAKLIYPFENGWSIFAKLGAALVHQDVYNQILIGEDPIVDTNKTTVSPLIGFGLSFNFTPRLAAELYGQYIPSTKPIENVYATGLGLNYTL